MFKVRQKVLVKGDEINSSRPSKKLEHKRFGPFKIIKQTGPANFDLALTEQFKRLHKNFHADHLLPYHSDENSHRKSIPPPPVFLEDAEEPEYLVDYIKQTRFCEGKQEYLVHWKGYSDDKDTWEPLSSLNNAAKMVLNYHQRHKTRKVRRPNEIRTWLVKKIPEDLQWVIPSIPALSRRSH